MNKKLIAVLHMASLAVVQSADAQTNIFDNCRDVITAGLREYSIQTDSVAYTNTVFDRYCEASGNMRSRSLGLGLNAVVDALPIGLTGSYSAHEEGMRNFCRNYAASTAARDDSLRYEERTVERAYTSFDQCLSLAQNGVIVRHAVRNLEQADFFVAPGFGRPVAIRGVQKTSNITCEALVGDQLIEFGLDTPVTLADSNTLNLACTRSKSMSDDGVEVFDEAVITIFTNVSPNGNYSAYMPRDSLLPERRASEIEMVLSSLTSRLESATGLIEQTDNRLNSLEFTKVCRPITDAYCGGSPPSCPDAWNSTDLIEVNTWTGGRCGRGNECRVCYRVGQ